MKKEPTKARFKTVVILPILSFLLLVFSPTVFAAPATVVYQGNTTEKIVALTFDDGDDGSKFTQILDVLDAQGVKATFYVTGEAAESFPLELNRAAASGHEIGSHAYNHLDDITEVSAAEVQNQLVLAETAIMNATGKSPKPHFRSPHGLSTETILEVAGNEGYSYFGHWSLDTNDWEGLAAETISNQVTANIFPGAVVLMHVNPLAVNTPEALATMIPTLKEMGYRFVTMSEMLQLSGTGTPEPEVPVSEVPVSEVPVSEVPVSEVPVSEVPESAVSESEVPEPIASESETPKPEPATPKPETPKPKPIATSSKKYTVRSGDTLHGIASKHKLTVAQIAAANKITNINLIRVGQVLNIPGTSASTPANTSTTRPAVTPTATTYKVRAGDTLYLIAKKFNRTVSQIAATNKITNINVIRVGQVLKISGTTGGTTAKPVATTSGKTYKVRAGDTLSVIARQHKTTVAKLVSANKLSNANILFIGQVLKIK